MISVVITAGGSSTRFNGNNKLLYELNSKPVIMYSVELFNSLEFIDEVIVSANESLIPIFEKMFEMQKKVKVVQGGNTRQKSVFNGLKSCNKPDFVLIHDAARPFVTRDVIINCLNKAKETGASIVAVKTIDTIKIVDENGIITSTPNRMLLWNAQTPQIFKYDLILSLHEKYSDLNFTDDSLLFEKAGLPVAISQGDYSNIKITTIQDVEKINNKD